MNLEEMYAVLLGASGRERQGASYAVVHRWFSTCGIIDGRLVDEHAFAKAFERLAPNRESLTMTQFIQFIGILSRETKQDVNTFLLKFRAVQQDIVDEIQAQFKSVESNRRYSKQTSKIIDNTKAAEEKARSLFEDTANKQQVELAKFMEALEKIAVQQKKSVEDLVKTLAEQGPKMLEKLQAGIKAFKEAVSK